MSKTGRLFVISGPSGVGKGTLIREVLSKLSDIGVATSVTTRASRPGEVDGETYHFLSLEQFEERIQAGAFLEWCHVHQNKYGTLHSEVDQAVKVGQDVILEIDTQGAEKVKGSVAGDVTMIFVVPPSMSLLQSRLEHRNTEKLHDIMSRMSMAYHEIQAVKLYDYVLVNDQLDVAVEELIAIITKVRDNKG